MNLSNKRIQKKAMGNFHRAMETKNNIFFICFDVPKTLSIRMFDRKMKLVAEEKEAYKFFKEELKSPLNYWKSDLLKKHLEKTN